MQEKSWTSPQGNQLCYHMCPCMYTLGDLFTHFTNIYSFASKYEAGFVLTFTISPMD